jgi:xanthine dehydrogenase YagR molybdenum-binding subunit
VLTTEPGFHGAPVAAVAAESYERAREALALVDVEWEELEPLLDPRRPCARESLHDEPRRYERGDVDAGFAEADVVVEAEYRTQTVLTTRWRRTSPSCRWEGDTLEVYISTQFIWGVRDDVAEQLGLPADRIRVVLQLHGRRLRRQERGARPDVHRHRARHADRAAGALRALSARGEPGDRQPKLDHPAAARRRIVQDGTIVALEGEFVNAVGWKGWSGPTYGPMENAFTRARTCAR